jgi:hypothetical protein
LKSIVNLSRIGAAVLLLSLSACSDSDGGGPTPPGAPTVLSTSPASGATNVLAAAAISVTFSEAMDATTLDATTFSLVSGAAVIPVDGAVTYAGTTAVFANSAPLASDTTYTATVRVGAKSLAGKPLAATHTWSFSTGSAVVPPVAPTVVSTSPADAATNVFVNGVVSVTFSQAMDPASISTTSFTLTSGAPAVAVAGTVSGDGSTAEFLPDAHLAADTLYTATVTVGATNLLGMPLAASKAWSFTTGSVAPQLLPVDLRTAGDYVILANSAISTQPTSDVTGNLGLSAAASYITGFSLIADPTNQFSTSSQVIGKVYAFDYKPPTPTNLTSAITDMMVAFADAAGRAPDFIGLGAGNIGGKTLPPGVYKWGTGLLIPTSITLKGSATDVWIFEIAQGLTISNGVKVLLAGGALPKNIFWQVGSAATLGTTSHCEGVILAKASIALATGASINGRLMAQTAVTIDSSKIVEPAP